MYGSSIVAAVYAAIKVKERCGLAISFKKQGDTHKGSIESLIISQNQLPGGIILTNAI